MLDSTFKKIVAVSGVAAALVIVSAILGFWGLGGGFWAALVAFLSLPAIAYSAYMVMALRQTVQDCSQLIGQVIKGDLSARINRITTRDEIGIIQHRLNNLVDIIDLHARGKDALIYEDSDTEYYRKISRSPLMEKLDHCVEASGEKSESIESLLSGVEAKPQKETVSELSRKLRIAIREWMDLCANMQDSIAKVSSGNSGAAAQSQKELSGMAHQAQINMESVATASEELAYSIREIGQRVTESSRIANLAVDHARQSNVIMNSLNEASDRIGNVVKLITTIAGQTNLLALNATIEAARAGDAGRGFAVVATEVKSLADQTAKATDDIAQQVGHIQSSTQSAVVAIQEIGATIDKISEISMAIASAVQEQSAVTDEMTRNIQQAANGTQQVSKVIETLEKAPGADNNKAANDARHSLNKLMEQLSVLDEEIRREAA